MSRCEPQEFRTNHEVLGILPVLAEMAADDD
jgi:hypothetical protein